MVVMAATPTTFAMRARPCGRRAKQALGALVLTAALFVSVAAVEVVFDLDGSSAWAQAVVVAKVNGDPITDRELQRLLVQASSSRQIEQESQPTRILPDPASPQKIDISAADRKKLEQAALQRLIRFHLLLQEAARRNLAVTEKELTQAQAALRRRFKDDQSYVAWRKSQDLSDDKSLRDALRSELLVARAAAALVRQTSFSEPEMRTYYEKHKSEFQVPATARLQVIAVKDRAAADGIVTALKQGEDFGRLARERSSGFRAAQGGDLGWVTSDKLPPTLRMAAGSLKLGETSDALPMGSEFLIVRVVARRPARMKTLAEAQPEIKRSLQRESQAQIIASWLAKQEKESKIEILL